MHRLLYMHTDLRCHQAFVFEVYSLLFPFYSHAGNDEPYKFTHLKQDKSAHVLMVSWMNSIPRLSSSWPSPLPLLVHLATGFLPRLRFPPGSSKASKWTWRSLRSPEIMNKWLNINWSSDAAWVFKSLTPDQPSSQQKWAGLAVWGTPLSRVHAPVARPSPRRSVLGWSGGSRMTLKTLRTRGLRLRTQSDGLLLQIYILLWSTYIIGNRPYKRQRCEGRPPLPGRPIPSSWKVKDHCHLTTLQGCIFKIKHSFLLYLCLLISLLIPFSSIWL